MATSERATGAKSFATPDRTPSREEVGYQSNSCHHRSQRRDRAPAHTRPPLCSEGYDAVQHRMRGNPPHAFVQVLHLETANRLATAQSALRAATAAFTITTSKEGTVDEIPKPELLNPDRENRDDREDFTAKDHRSQSQLLAKALGESCAYADQLWEQVNALRGYLLDSLPPDPRSPGPHTTAAASPTGPDDDDGWQNWINVFATTTSVLCGSHGDSGFGLSRARDEARLRRAAPAPTMHARQPRLDGPEPTPTVSQDPAPTLQPPDEPPADVTATIRSIGKTAVAAVVTVLALRGLRTRPGTDRNSDKRT